MTNTGDIDCKLCFHTHPASERCPCTDDFIERVLNRQSFGAYLRLLICRAFHRWRREDRLIKTHHRPVSITYDYQCRCGLKQRVTEWAVHKH